MSCTARGPGLEAVRRQARLRTGPLYAPDVRPGPDGTRPSGIGQLSVLMPPGTYTVRFKVGDYEQNTRLRERNIQNVMVSIR